MRTRQILARATLITGVIAGGCGPKAVSPSEHETPTLSVTHWTDKTELFMEHPPLVGGQTALFAVHLTTMNDFKALNAGKPRLEFVPESGGSPVVLQGGGPSRPGAFRIEAAAPPPATYTWALVIDAPGFSDRHNLGSIAVFADEAAAMADAEKRSTDDPSAISYLKEQQWTNEFATEPVRVADLRNVVRVPATVEPISGGEAIITAPAAGRFTAGSLPRIGAPIAAGQTLGQLQPRGIAGEDRAAIAADVAEAQASTEAARAEAMRAQRLVDERAVPARRAEDANRALAIAESRLRAVQARLAQRDETLRSGGGAASGNTFMLRAPIAGRLADVFATLGASYEEGAPLFRIVRTDRVELRAQIPAADALVARNITALAFEVPGRTEPLTLQVHDAHDPGVLDPTTRALPVQFEVSNPANQLLVGQSGTALLYQREQRRVPAAPKSAVLMEAGRPYVFVQTTGEAFARRFIEIVARDGDLVGIKSGVQPGDRVVTRGAYEIQLASAAKGLPAEGHVH
jgi:cobalt-zinc-cadmium efflux system membrane fusion protein